MPWPDDPAFKLVGSPDLDKCRDLILTYLNVNVACPYGDRSKQYCGLNGQYQPKFDFNKPIYGISTIYTYASFFGFYSTFTLEQFKIKAD